MGDAELGALLVCVVIVAFGGSIGVFIMLCNRLLYYNFLLQSVKCANSMSDAVNLRMGFIRSWRSSIGF